MFIFWLKQKFGYLIRSQLHYRRHVSWTSTKVSNDYPNSIVSFSTPKRKAAILSRWSHLSMIQYKPFNCLYKLFILFIPLLLSLSHFQTQTSKKTSIANPFFLYLFILQESRNLSLLHSHYSSSTFDYVFFSLCTR